jgi:hypothetical protein
MLVRNSRPLPRVDEHSTVLHMVERFMILFWIPEWSIVVAANQGIATVLLATIRFNTSTCNYEIVPEMSLPESSERNPETHIPLSGVSCYRIDESPAPSASSSTRASSTSPSTPSRQAGFFYRLHLQLDDLVTYDLHMADNGSILVEEAKTDQAKQSTSATSGQMN